MKLTAEITRLRNEADEMDLEGEGFAARLGQFIESGAAEPKDDEPLVAPPPASTPGETPPTSETPPTTPTAGEDEDEEEMPSIGEAPKPKPEDKPFDEAAFDAETEKEVQGLDPKQAAAWKKIKERTKAAEKRAHELAAAATSAKPPKEVEVELEQLRATAREVEGLRQRNEELLRANDQTAVRESPEFQSTVTAPLKEIGQVLATMAEQAQLDPRLLAAAVEESDIAKQDQMLDQLSEKLSSRSLTRLERLSDDYKAIVARERSLLENAGKTIEEQRQARARQEAQEKERAREVFKGFVSDSFTNYAKRVPGFVDSTGNMTDLAQAVMDKTAAVDPHSLSSSDLGYMAFAANAFPELRKAYVALQKENAILRASSGSSPSIDGKPPVGGHKPDDDVLEDGLPEGLVDRFRKTRFAPA